MDALPRGDLLLRLLEATALRARVLSANIANQNTPGYVRREVRFEELLREALESGREVTGLRAEVALDRQSPARADGNNVRLEDELGALRENRILYETYAAILAGRSRLRRIAVTEGR